MRLDQTNCGYLYSEIPGGNQKYVLEKCSGHF